jgi:TonB family protein
MRTHRIMTETIRTLLVGFGALVLFCGVEFASPSAQAAPNFGVLSIGADPAPQRSRRRRRRARRTTVIAEKTPGVTTKRTVLGSDDVTMEGRPTPPGSENAGPPPPRPSIISGGVLNGKAISLPQPLYPRAARRARVSGSVTVLVTIDEEGKVISAEAASGPHLLREPAVTAARAAKFSVTKLSGYPVKVRGAVVYKFSLK